MVMALAAKAPAPKVLHPLAGEVVDTSPAWDIARSAGRAPDGAEDGCKKNCKGFPPPTPGAKFEEGLEAKDR